ncbi:MAG TPA: alpha-amylase, partial [Terracidiphilus sp.]
QRQRWFGAKARHIQAARVLDWVALPATQTAVPADPSAGNSIAPALFFVEVDYADGGCGVYQIPLAISAGADADEVNATYPQSVLTALALPMGPAILHDATVLEGFRQALLELIAQNTTLALLSTGGEAPCGAQFADGAEEEAHPHAGESAPARHPTQPRESPAAGETDVSSSAIHARASRAFVETNVLRGLPSRVGSAEQSNTSIVYGNQLILKLFRRLQPGENPDVEIGRFLTEVARFKNIPPFLGEIAMARPGWTKTTLAMLQGLVTNQGDGWEWFLERLGTFFSSVAALPASASFSPVRFSMERHAAPELAEHAEDTLEAAALLGRRTAEMHLAMATPTSDPAFAAEPLTAEDLTRESNRIAGEVSSAMEVLKLKISALDDAASDDAGLVLARRRELLERARSVAALKAGGMRIRIHGDYHLGQTLRVVDDKAEIGGANGDFVLLDFEGEPARPLADRRQKQSPLKDVAGMVRSFSYAANSALDRHIKASAEPVESGGSDGLQGWARRWYEAASAAFLITYRQVMTANAAILPLAPQCDALFGAYLLEKALYELVYELNNRPAWVRIPLAGILNT